jgi:hypothetical protein
VRQSRIVGNHAAQIKTFLGGPSRGGGLYMSDGHLRLAARQASERRPVRGQRHRLIGLAGVRFASLTTAICTVTGNTVTLITTGACAIQATQAGNASFNPAPPIAQSFAVKSSQKQDQTITFAKPADKRLGDLPFSVNATASSGLPVRFTSNTSAVCTVSGNTVTLIATGTCSITASQEGNAQINPATPVTQSFIVSPQGGGGGEQRIYLPLVVR